MYALRNVINLELADLPISNNKLYPGSVLGLSLKSETQEFAH